MVDHSGRKLHSCLYRRVYHQAILDYRPSSNTALGQVWIARSHPGMGKPA